MEAMMTETSGESGYPNASKSASSVALLAGMWFFASPWVYGSYLLPSSWNNWIVGSVITVLALARLSTADLKRTQWISWANCLLAIWVFVSPWIFQYADNTDRLVNSVCVGVILFFVAIFSALAISKANTLVPHRR
jgi:SPW repeat